MDIFNTIITGCNYIVVLCLTILVVVFTVTIMKSFWESIRD